MPAIIHTLVKILLISDIYCLLLNSNKTKLNTPLVDRGSYTMKNVCLIFSPMLRVT